MAVASLGFRTDLMILSLLGSTVEHEDGYAVVRTPSNPTFHWGNFLLLAGPPAPGSVPGWVETFSRTFPDAEHLTLGVDGTDGEAGDPAELARLGLEREISTVMTATTVHPPPRPNTYATYRPLDGDADWSAALAVRAAGNEDFPPEDYLVFARRHLDSMRALQEQGYGAWFGAFVDDAMVAGLGIFADTDGVARFQSVDTHPAHRNRGIAGTLVHHASRYALDTLHAGTLVMVADPSYSAIRVYRSIGFDGTETQVQLFRPTPG